MSKLIAEDLERSTDMEPVTGSVEVDAPVGALWEVFRRPHEWPHWNDCFSWVGTRRLARGGRLIWCFEPLRPEYLYRMPAIATIVELEEARRVTWEVTALPGFYARHTYFMEPLGERRARFGSWEKATGWSFRAARRFWLAHFRFVLDRSLAGARRLGEGYAAEGRIALGAARGEVRS